MFEDNKIRKYGAEKSNISMENIPFSVIGLLLWADKVLRVTVIQAEIWIWHGWAKNLNIHLHMCKRMYIFVKCFMSVLSNVVQTSFSYSKDNNRRTFSKNWAFFSDSWHSFFQHQLLHSVAKNTLVQCQDFWFKCQLKLLSIQFNFFLLSSCYVIRKRVVTCKTQTQTLLHKISLKYDNCFLFFWPCEIVKVEREFLHKIPHWLRQSWKQTENIHATQSLWSRWAFFSFDLFRRLFHVRVLCKHGFLACWRQFLVQFHYIYTKEQT